MAEDPRPQLWGRGVREQPRVYASGPRHLWSHYSSPPQQASIIVYTDGTVVEGFDFEGWEIDNPDVLMFIMGGSDFRCDEGSDVHTYLLAAGYTFGVNTGG